MQFSVVICRQRGADKHADEKKADDSTDGCLDMI